MERPALVGGPANEGGKKDRSGPSGRGRGRGRVFVTRTAQEVYLDGLIKILDDKYGAKNMKYIKNEYMDYPEISHLNSPTLAATLIFLSQYNHQPDVSEFNGTNLDRYIPKITPKEFKEEITLDIKHRVYATFYRYALILWDIKKRAQEQTQ